MWVKQKLLLFGCRRVVRGWKSGVRVRGGAAGRAAAPVAAESFIKASGSAPGAFEVNAGRRTPGVAMTLPPDDAIFNFTMDFSDIETVLMGDAHDSTNVTVVDIFMEQLAMTLNVYYTPVLIILGFIGNMVSVIVFFRSKLRLQSTSQYLSALALADTLFLWQLLPPWLKAVGASTLFSRHGFCQLFVYLSYVSCNVSSWLVVAFTIERFVAVVYPLKRNAMCTVRRARYIIGTLTTIALLINLPVLRFAVPSGNDCNIDELLMAHAARFNLFDTLVSFTLPLAMIVVLNAWIMWGVYRVSRARPNLTRQQWPVHARSPRTARASACRRSQQRITKMLLIVSSVFVLLNLPAYTMRIVAYANNMVSDDTFLCFKVHFKNN